MLMSDNDPEVAIAVTLSFNLGWNKIGASIVRTGFWGVYFTITFIIRNPKEKYWQSFRLPLYLLGVESSIVFGDLGFGSFRVVEISVVKKLKSLCTVAVFIV